LQVAYHPNISQRKIFMDESSMKERGSEQEDHSLFYQLRVRKIVKFNLGGIFSILKLSMLMSFDDLEL